jgi:hypothetical protein
MRHCLFVSAVLGLSCLQCSTTTETKGAKYPDATSFCAGVAAAECSDAVVQACAAANKNTCITKEEATCTSTYITPALSAGYGYNSGPAENCVNAISAAYSDAKIDSTDLANIAAACGPVFSGAGAKGSSCAVDADCAQADGLRCVIHAAPSAGDAGEIEGTCQVPQTVNGGGTCSAVDAQCVTGYHCGTTSHCDQNEALNASCSGADPCDTGLMCTAGRCVAKIANGSDCTTNDECASGICIAVTGANNICSSVETLSPSEPFCAAIRG